jgi:hypothetical protein
MVERPLHQDISIPKSTNGKKPARSLTTQKISSDYNIEEIKDAEALTLSRA